MDIAERLKAVRKHYKLSQTAFGKPLGASRNSINDVENGRTKPSNMLIAILCREYNVNEVWLRTGEGEMLRARTQQEEIASFVGSILREDGDNDFQRALLAVMARTTPAEWVIFKRKLDELSAEIKKTGE